ncbi:hypothetical protein RHGRI_033182 [Rhododendron griersonianum]|uniref:Uncharacterized protein n=1 Tax=Rhododendron griersonianum TaxID=479676 RepID=A0AAV6HYY7_9ERIC|nr:hypothetical protein RHGRI_033182 [Rhododendron griersonianum]
MFSILLESGKGKVFGYLITFPRRSRASGVPIFSSILSTSVSTRLTKKEATLVTLERSLNPEASRPSKNLYVDIGTINHFMKPFCSLNSPYSIISKSGRNFNRNVTITSVCLIVDWLKKFACILNVLHHKFPICTFNVFSCLYKFSAKPAI